MTFVHLDHDFPYENWAAPATVRDEVAAAAFRLAGEVDGAPVYRSNDPTSVGPARLPAPDAAVLPDGDVPVPLVASPSGHAIAAAVMADEVAEYRSRAEYLGQLIELLVAQLAPATGPGIWGGFLARFRSAGRVERLEQLPAATLHTVVEQAYTVAAARGGR